MCSKHCSIQYFWASVVSSHALQQNWLTFEVAAIVSLSKSCALRMNGLQHAYGCADPLNSGIPAIRLNTRLMASSQPLSSDPTKDNSGECIIRLDLQSSCVTCLLAMALILPWHYTLLKVLF